MLLRSPDLARNVLPYQIPVEIFLLPDGTHAIGELRLPSNYELQAISIAVAEEAQILRDWHAETNQLDELVKYPDRSEHVAPEATYYAQLKREKSERHVKARYRLGGLAMGAALAAGTLATAFIYDQQTLAQMAYGDTVATMHSVYSSEHLPHQPRDIKTDVIFIPGTGIKDATKGIAEPLAPAFESMQDVELMALEEGAHPQIEATFRAVDKAIEKEPPGRLILYGMSVGGKEALLIAAHVRETYPDTDIVIVLDSTPYDQDSAFQLQGTNNSDIKFVTLATDLKIWGGPAFRYGVEMFNRRNECFPAGALDVRKCLTTSKQIIQDKLSPNSTSNELYLWQAMLTVDDFADSALATLKNVPGGPKTSILYISTKFDTIVDEYEAIPKYAASAKKYNIPMTRFSLNDEHASEYRHPKDYTDLALGPFLAKLAPLPTLFGPAAKSLNKAKTNDLAGVVAPNVDKSMSKYISKPPR